ncbi:MAG: hypothetical protein WBE76_32170 [Terracidiphilus sp.]
MNPSINSAKNPNTIAASFLKDYTPALHQRIPERFQKRAKKIFHRELPQLNLQPHVSQQAANLNTDFGVQRFPKASS